ncbi:CBS domain-containing protein [Streptomyces griseosporeus]|uniref:CBS domain-containing protein n=1 Tax=Streptomyces griseosporeus TaxID=1910 RepID=UPI0036840E19
MKHDKVASVMTTEVVSATYGTPFKEVARLLAEHGVSGLPVVDEDRRVIGVISETDLLARQADGPLPYEPSKRFRLPALTREGRRRAAKARARTAGQLMSAPPVTVPADATIAEAARAMARHRVERLPVCDADGRLAGIVTRRDLLAVFLRPDEEIRRRVVDEVLAGALWLPPRSVDVSVTEGVVALSGQVERRSEREIALTMTQQIDGVVAVVDGLSHRLDDSRIRPDEPSVHGIADDWPRRR